MVLDCIDSRSLPSTLLKGILPFGTKLETLGDPTSQKLFAKLSNREKFMINAPLNSFIC